MPFSNHKGQHSKNLTVFLLFSCTLIQFYFCLKITADLRFSSFLFSAVLMAFYSWLAESLFGLFNLKKAVIFYDFKGRIFEIVMTITTILILNQADANMLFFQNLLIITLIEIALQFAIWIVLFY